MRSKHKTERLRFIRIKNGEVDLNECVIDTEDTYFICLSSPRLALASSSSSSSATNNGNGGESLSSAAAIAVKSLKSLTSCLELKMEDVFSSVQIPPAIKFNKDQMDLQVMLCEGECADLNLKFSEIYGKSEVREGNLSALEVIQKKMADPNSKEGDWLKKKEIKEKRKWYEKIERGKDGRFTKGNSNNKTQQTVPICSDDVVFVKGVRRMIMDKCSDKLKPRPEVNQPQVEEKLSLITESIIANLGPPQVPSIIIMDKCSDKLKSRPAAVNFSNRTEVDPKPSLPAESIIITTNPDPPPVPSSSITISLIDSSPTKRRKQVHDKEVNDLSIELIDLTLNKDEEEYPKQIQIIESEPVTINKDAYNACSDMQSQCNDVEFSVTEDVEDESEIEIEYPSESGSFNSSFFSSEDSYNTSGPKIISVTTLSTDPCPSRKSRPKRTLRDRLATGESLTMTSSSKSSGPTSDKTTSPDKHHCKLGDRNYSCATALRRHHYGVHLKLRGFECIMCKKAYTQQAHLDYHMKATHLGIRELKCTRCGIFLPGKTQLRTHRKTVCPPPNQSQEAGTKVSL